MNRFTLGMILCAGLAGVNPAQAQPLSLEDYIGQVEKSNPGVKASGLSSQAIAGKLAATREIYSPRLNASFDYTDDRSGENLESAIQANKLRSLAWDVSLSQRFATGTHVSAGYAQTSLDLDLPYPYTLTSDISLSQFKAYDIKPYVQIEQSLLKELAGGLTEAGIRKNQFLAQAAQYQQLAGRQTIVFNAESAYLRLSLCRETVKFRQESLARSEELVRWSESKLTLDLAETSDLLQARAQRRQASMELQNALDDEQDAGREFNHMRNQAAGAEPEELQKLADLLDRDRESDLSGRQDRRADVLMAQASLRASECAERENSWTAGPELTAFGRLSLHGLDLDYPPAFRQVSAGEKPTLTLGASLSLPLDFSIHAQVAQGFRQDREAGRALWEEAQANAEKDWALLGQKWKRLSGKLAAAREVRDLQALRLAEERKKYRQGKTTTFQLLSAENDLDQATLLLTQMMSDALAIRFQSALYNTPTILPE